MNIKYQIYFKILIIFKEIKNKIPRKHIDTVTQTHTIIKLTSRAVFAASKVALL